MNWMYSGGKGEGKGNILPTTGHEGSEEEQIYSSNLPLTSVLDGGKWSTARPGRFTRGKDKVPVVQEAGWAPGPVCKISPPPGLHPRIVQPVETAIEV